MLVAFLLAFCAGAGLTRELCGRAEAWHTNTRDGQGLTEPGNQASDLLAPLLPAGEPVEQLLRKAQFFAPGTPTAISASCTAGAAGARRSFTGSGGGMTRWCGPRTG